MQSKNRGDKVRYSSADDKVPDHMFPGTEQNHQTVF